MAYTPTEWKNGDVITAEKLNKLEEGVQAVSDNSLIITVSWDENESKYVMDKSFDELNDAYDNGIKLKVNAFGSYLDFKGRDISMVGYSYYFSGVFCDGVLLNNSSVPSLRFDSIIINNNRIELNTKTVPLN